VVGGQAGKKNPTLIFVHHLDKRVQINHKKVRSAGFGSFSIG
jgi:hypothetical protein